MAKVMLASYGSRRFASNLWSTRSSTAASATRLTSGSATNVARPLGAEGKRGQPYYVRLWLVISIRLSDDVLMTVNGAVPLIAAVVAMMNASVRTNSDYVVGGG